MTLNDWVRTSGKNSKDVAAALGCSSSFVRELMRGGRMPSVEMAQAIHTLTAGNVGLADWPSKPSSPEAAPASPAQPAGELAGIEGDR